MHSQRTSHGTTYGVEHVQRSLTTGTGRAAEHRQKRAQAGRRWPLTHLVPDAVAAQDRDAPLMQPGEAVRGEPSEAFLRRPWAQFDAPGVAHPAAQRASVESASPWRSAAGCSAGGKKFT